MSRWLVTGCSTGIGREIARAALEAGHSVVVTARRAETVADFAADFGDRAVIAALDVTDKKQITAAVRAAENAFSGIDVLVNNAGNGYLSAIEEGEDERVRKLFDTNYFGVVDTIKAVLPGMRARRSGHIVNISSMTGLVANPPNAYYSSTKFALEALTEALAQEVKPLGIKVTAIEPGAFRTDWAARSMWESSTPIGDYDENVGARKTMIKVVERQGRRIMARRVDVRDGDAVDDAVADGVREFGRLDIVIGNAGIIRVSDTDERRRTFRDVVEVNLIGVWNTVDAAIPALIAGGRGGSIVLTSSTQGIKASGTERPGLQGYAASKRALVALMQGWALQLAPHSIRVNTIHPSGVATDMIINETTMALAAAGDPWLLSQQNALPIALVQPEQIAAAVAWLVSDAAGFITGTSWPLDAGFTLKS